MSRSVRKLIEKLIEGLLALSSSITSITVLLIIIFLFKEGLDVFNHRSIEETHILAVNKTNPVNTLSAAQVKDIFDGKVIYWDQVGGKHDSIRIFRIDNITDYYTDEQIGKDFEFLPQRLNELMDKQTGILAFFSREYVAKNFTGKEVKGEEVSAASFLLGKQWFPTAEPSAQLGVLPLILGTLWVSLGAILIALPLGLATAIFMAEIANKRMRSFLKPVVELLAGIPSVVYGFFGLIIIVPAIQQAFGLPVGESGLAGSIILGIMALPTIITISEDALRTTPRALKEASLALGASHWQTITKVVVPYARSGITAAIILGVGRAIGETMAVLMVTGNAAVIPHSYFEPLRTIPATIAAELGEAPYGGLHFKALFALGCILFIITFLINLIFTFIARKRR